MSGRIVSLRQCGLVGPGGGANRRVESLGAVEQWLTGLPAWLVLLVVFGVVFAEDAIFVGFVFPGETVLLVGGAVASFGRLPVWAVFGVGAAAAVLGDSVGFEVGRQVGPRLRSSRLARLVKDDHWARAEAFMGRHGGPSVFLGRWVSFGRALVPALSGATRMRYRSFLAWNAVGGVCWAAAVTAVGFIAGDSWQRLGDLFGRAVLLVVLAVVFVVVVVAGARWCVRHPDRVRARLAGAGSWPPVRWVSVRFGRELRWVAARFTPGAAAGLTLTTGVVAVLITGWLSGAIVQDLLGREGAVLLDAPTARWLASHGDLQLTRVARVVHVLTGVIGSLVICGLFGALVCWRLRRPRPVVWLVIASLGSAALAWLLAAPVGRSGPSGPLVAAQSGGAFPNAATTVGVASALGVLVVMVRLGSSWAWLVGSAAAGLLWVAAAAGTALYLRVGWLSDVLAGAALGATWVAVLATVWLVLGPVRAAGTGQPEDAGATAR
jgi:membrane protein DedA with SNARE-associated domain